VSGCSIGGGTFWGLVRLLTKFTSFPDAIEAAEKGDNSKVAMLVKDIYGGSYSKLGLPGDIVACDFGKVAVSPLPHGGAWKHLPRIEADQSSSQHKTPRQAADLGARNLNVAAEPWESTEPESHDPIREEDLVRGVLVLVLNNTAQVAWMTAREQNVRRVFFVGSFLREGLMMRILTSALKFWSGGSLRAGFLKHEGYFGAMGALLHAR